MPPPPTPQIPEFQIPKGNAAESQSGLLDGGADSRVPVFCTMRYDFCTSLHDLIRSCTMQYCVVRICCATLNDSARLEGAWGGNWNLWQVLVGIYSPICGRTLLYLSKTYLGRSWKVPKGCQNGTKIQPKRCQNGSDKGPYGVHGCQNASRGVQELQISNNLKFS